MTATGPLLAACYVGLGFVMEGRTFLLLTLSTNPVTSSLPLLFSPFLSLCVGVSDFFCLARLPTSLPLPPCSSTFEPILFCAFNFQCCTGGSLLFYCLSNSFLLYDPYLGHGVFVLINVFFCLFFVFLFLQF